MLIGDANILGKQRGKIFVYLVSSIHIISKKIIHGSKTPEASILDKNYRIDIKLVCSPREYNVSYETIQNMEKLESPSLDFIAGLISTGATFMWVKQKQTEVPVFQIKMQTSQYGLLEAIKTKLGLTETIHNYQYKNRDYLLLLVRKRSILENIIIPTFEGRLMGNKKIQFENWKNKYFEKKLTFIYKRNG